MFEWLIECIKSLGYTIGRMEISRLHSSCRFVFLASIEKTQGSPPGLEICSSSPVREIKKQLQGSWMAGGPQPPRRSRCGGSHVTSSDTIFSFNP